MDAAAAGTVLVGVLGILIGFWGFVDSRSARFFKLWWRRTPYLGFGLGPGGPALYLLDGLGLLLVGLALGIGRNTITLMLLWIGCGAIAVGLVVYLIHPAWAQPTWMRHQSD